MVIFEIKLLEKILNGSKGPKLAKVVYAFDKARSIRNSSLNISNTV